MKAKSTNSGQAERRAAKAGLVYVSDMEQGIRRVRCGKGFTYKTPRGGTLKSDRQRMRIERLVIPPAWDDVFICSQSNGHLQAIGTDEAGRTQYLYHERWKAISAAAKFDRMHLFGNRLPRIRRRILADLNVPGVTRARVLAAVVRLLDKGYLRIGSHAYTESNGAHGATTLLIDHVEIDQSRVRLDFPGKSGQQREIEFSDAKVAAVIQQCEQLDGQFLFQFLDADDEPHEVRSTSVNEYLQEICGEDITAKDFRTWWGSVLAFSELEVVEPDDPPAKRKRIIATAISRTAEELGNTKAVCKSSYIHPGLLAACESGELPTLIKRLPKDTKRQMTIDETRFLAILPRLDCT